MYYRLGLTTHRVPKYHDYRYTSLYENECTFVCKRLTDFETTENQLYRHQIVLKYFLRLGECPLLCYSTPIGCYRVAHTLI